MDQIEKMSVRALYRAVLKGLKTYPSKNRDEIRLAFIQDVADWKTLTDEDEIAKAVKRIQMLHGHVTMWGIKMEEVLSTKDEKIEKPMPFRDINRKEDKDFIYF